jgi:nucleoside 2-deoxyribosyltransferase
MRLIYVAGPFRAPNSWAIEQNIRRAETVALELWRMGAAVICPHANTRFYQGAAPDEVWLEGDLEMLGRCDAVVLVENWEKSAGTMAERSYAKLHNIPVFEWRTEQPLIAQFIENRVTVQL